MAAHHHSVHEGYPSSEVKTVFPSTPICETASRTQRWLQLRSSSAEAISGRRPEMAEGVSLRTNFAWTLAGNAVYAVCQWGMLVSIAKLGSPAMVGQFALGLA